MNEKIKEEPGYVEHVSKKRKMSDLQQPSGEMKSVPAKTYSFKLDEFQQQAVNFIEKGESVLVAAHTSAGKTAVAEYAIAKSLRDKQRVVYTSPIKALSNQKYRDLQEEFQDVGLMTGDMTINPDATCLIMTTEILRSMLYRGSEVMREVAWVIYDEVHYMRDKERGVVWEESIILLPHKVRFVFLSATIPNSKEFVSWISKIHHQPCHVVYTEYRPVPLQHFLFPSSGDGLYLVVDEKGQFREENFLKAMSNFQKDPENVSTVLDRKKSKVTRSISSDLLNIVKLIMDRNLDPCIVFSFSKKDCETYALQMSRMDFNVEEEKFLVEEVFSGAMAALSEDDKLLPQVNEILPLLKRGIGIHHGGLLPILKEVIEILFQEGLIKCLFATETFSIGINMPAKTVVFTATRKFDGRDFRWITSGEYIQMSGRAGRRGKDDKGLVIQMIDEKVDPDVVKGMIYGASDPLYSSYQISYNMVLNMLRVEDANPELLIKSSFHQYQQEQKAPEFLQKAEELKVVASSILLENESDIGALVELRNCLRKIEDRISTLTMQSKHCLPFLQSGRLVQFRLVDVGVVWGIVVKYGRSDKHSNKIDGNLCKVEIFYSTEDLLSSTTVLVDLADITKLSAIRLSLPNNLSRHGAALGVRNAMTEVVRRFGVVGIPLLDAVDDMKIPDSELVDLKQELVVLNGKLKNVEEKLIDVNDHSIEQYTKKATLIDQANILVKQATEFNSVSMTEELKNRKRVLKKLDFITDDEILCLKGKFSCELTTGDELVLTTLIFNGAFQDLSVAQTVALLSCFVHQEPTKAESLDRLRKEMQIPVQNLMHTAKSIGKICADAHVIPSEEDYVRSFNPGLVEATYQWSIGAKFSDVCKLTDTFEGNIIRVFRRLDELLRQLASASLAIGNGEMVKLFEDGSKSIRRGVVFAASLYL